ncbi:MAG: hypothetical protein ACRDSK_31260 [Actinophytocola sp.]|uniref:hypothetical protein n=1 Tax=Actinophytocola sp. TaxID=1872138 RepID=UPI003D6ABDB6
MPRRQAEQLVQAIAEFGAAYEGDPEYADSMELAGQLAATVLEKEQAKQDTPGSRSASRARSSTGGALPQ